MLTSGSRLLLQANTGKSSIMSSSFLFEPYGRDHNLQLLVREFTNVVQNLQLLVRQLSEKVLTLERDGFVLRQTLTDLAILRQEQLSARLHRHRFDEVRQSSDFLPTATSYDILATPGQPHPLLREYPMKS